jgi:hypothetical protein
MDHIRTHGPPAEQGENWEDLFQQYFTCKLFQVNPSLFTDWQGTAGSEIQGEKHWILSKIRHAREVMADRGEGSAGPNEVGFLVWSLSRNFMDF